MTEFLIGSGVCVRIHEDPVELFAICLFSVTADPTCDTPRKKEMETKYPGKWREKQRTRPICFVSRNQKHPGRHFYCFLETKHAKNQGLFPMFPFPCVSTSTLLLGVEWICQGGQGRHYKLITIIGSIPKEIPT